MDQKRDHLSPTEWKRLQDVLFEVMSLEQSEWNAFLDATTLDEKLRNEVEALLANSDVIGNFLSLPAGAFAHDLLESHPKESERIGERFGNYEIVSVLGRGGMGTVYLAERVDDKFEQRVAIKVLNRELNNEELRRAFNREVQIQARLVHPNIASILDAGTTADDMPYIVMEYVEGIPIDRYCRDNCISQVAVLKLFNRVCDAVSFAHRNLIVHRDLKPGNILVNAVGQPKLLDFGISELVNPEKLGQTRLSLPGLTPGYSSPEQMAGEELGTSSDIFSLGVVMYKLLAGKLYRGPIETNSKGDLSLTGTRKKQEDRAELSEDLMSIFGKATDPDPKLRYHSVDKFSADIWRYIDGFPVEARANTISYRFKKFVLRRRFAVSAAAIILIVMLGGSAIALWQARNARIQAIVAKSEQERSEKISKFMMRIFSYANPKWWAAGRKYNGQARVIDAMKELEDEIETEFPDQPDVQAELHYRFAEVNLSHGGPGFRESAHRHATRALELRKEYYGDFNELVAKDMAYVYWTSESISDREISMIASAIVMLRATNASNRNLPFLLEDYGMRLFDDAKPEQAEAYYRNAPEHSFVSRHELADRYIAEMLELLRIYYGENEDPILACKCALAMTKAKIGDVDKAKEYAGICRSAIESPTADASRKNWRNRLDIAESLINDPPNQ